MTYRETIKNSLDKVKLDKFSGRCGHTYIEVMPCDFSCFLLAMSAVTAYYGFALIQSTELIDFIELSAGIHKDTESVITVQETMEAFVNWLLDEEIPEHTTNWYDVEELRSKWNQFALQRNWGEYRKSDRIHKEASEFMHEDEAYIHVEMKNKDPEMIVKGHNYAILYCVKLIIDRIAELAGISPISVLDMLKEIREEIE